MKRFALVFCLLLARLITPAPLTQAAPDATLMAEIAKIKAVDNHCHDLPVNTGRESKWSLATPLGQPPYPAVVRLRVDNPEWIRAWRALYGYTNSDMDADHLRALLQTKLRLIHDKGEAYPTWVLDQAGIETALVNARTLGAGQTGQRFRWVPYADPLISPLVSKKESLNTLLKGVRVNDLPATLDDYPAKAVTPILQSWRDNGALAVKFISAYSRSLEFADVDRAEAQRIYAQYTRGGEPSNTEIKTLQDFLFRYIAREAGRVGLPVHIHTGNGNGPYFNNSNANPGLLESMIGDPSMRQTTFVLLHGGWPFHKLARAMLDKPNTYADFSAQTFYLSTHALSEVLRDWLEWQPEKVLFGSDAYSDENTPLADWEEKAWLMTTTAREALGLALTGMMADGEITRPRAVEIARMVLRENAIKLYHLK